MLMPALDLKSAARKERTHGINCHRTPQCHQHDRDQHGDPNIAEVLLRFLCPNQEKYQGIGDKGDVFPERLQDLATGVRHQRGWLGVGP